jgi:TusA-related sulfurtransferase
MVDMLTRDTVEVLARDTVDMLTRDTVEVFARETVAMRVVDVRGSYDPGPLEQLIDAVRTGWVGETIAVRSCDRECLGEILAWVRANGHGVIGVREHHGYDEVIVEVRR